MRYIGAHVSSSGGVENAPLNAAKIGANAFALFVKNQRQWSAKPLEDKSIKAFKQNCIDAGILPKHILPHDSYLINLGHFDDTKREQSFNAFMDEIERVEQLGLELLNFHPGSHLKEISENECLSLIAECMNEAIRRSKNVKLVIENTAGQGSNLGYKFEHLAFLIERINDKSRVGVCLDTCHTFAAGYDLRTPEAYKKTMDEFDNIVGYDFLSAMHLNDSKFDLACKKDRHESLGKGFLGMSAFDNIINDERIEDIPLILETIDESIWKDEIEILRNLQKDRNV
ncbi:deoxyribonuclease IV [Campylobacter sp. RM9344]|uniref:Probable endonuclease 4 n=1 Tax=Campylobacter californiensis TaxID=1032243 RepID=A0AAW3ZT88_9BACT|nr:MULTISPECIES: deoxyribonuclease IV [unclassified Campylobacter]MBE2984557.1 deoxyribonuclease IV [Campylobacter sp. RM6883]MBE2987024.1 deoxyribonuclease IV [Campylobacter sp. RM12919]MBE2988689.1 deoxyribonuclease IV [Campylobacter sp. RM12920]MBE2995155.1 deoxyribonuclease IV [Campylobacter sp. RM6913]MBE3021694.1 deoxyribonuclease IV [Campylobacter sp. 7477a]MBE3029076.1 deoxyribonuclease IV [Campylobacter sp. RM9344]